MVKPEWGKKLSCPSCGARFYDLNKDPAICPKCETKVDVQPVLKPRRQPAKAPKPKKVVPVVDELDDDDEDVIELDDDDDIDLDDDDEDLIEDTSDLEEDDDVSEVNEHIEIDDETH